MSPVSTFFDASLRRGRTQKRIASLVVLVLCGIGGIWWMLEGGAGDRQMSRMLAMSMLGVPVALVIFATTFRRHRGLDALADPSQIVWVYGVMRGAMITKVMVGVASGTLHTLELGDPRRGEEGMRLLTAAAPQATVGFSEARRQAFNKSPSELRRAASG